MAFRLAVEARIGSRIAPWSAQMVETSGPARPMPLNRFHSLDDPWVPYRGSSRLYAGSLIWRGNIRRWKKRSRDGVRLTVVGQSAGRTVLKGAAGTRTREIPRPRYARGSCACGTEIVLGNHRFGPRVAGRARIIPLVIGQGTWVIDATRRCGNSSVISPFALGQANWSGT